MISNLVTFALGLFSGFPKPDLVSVDYGSVQAGVGYVINFSDIDHPNFFLRPDLGFSLGQIRCYWGKKLAFATGIEILRIDWGFTPLPEYFVITPSEILMPQVGFSYLFGPTRARCIGAGSHSGESYVPRIDLICGFSPFNWAVVGFSEFSPTLRVETKLLLNRSIQLVLENRNCWVSWDKLNSIHLSLAFALGKDIVKPEEGEIHE